MSEGSGPGRPRDPEVGARVLQAALEVYGRLGAAGFSVDAVAKAAGASKATIYRRWSDADDLLVDALQRALPQEPAIDTGSVRQDLITLTAAQLVTQTGPAGPALRRILVEGEFDPRLGRRRDEIIRSQVAGARTVLRRAVDRGELPAHAQDAPVLESLFGGAMMLVLTASPRLRREVAADPHPHAQRLTAFALDSLGHPEPPSTGTSAPLT